MEFQQLARRQHGIVTRAQAIDELGVERTRWRLERGLWQRVHPGVYQVHNGPVDWLARASAALLHYGEGAAPAEVISELAARRAHRHRLALQYALGVIGEGAESVLEVGFVRDVLDAHGLPRMRMAVVDGPVRRDFVDDERRIIVEVDGRIGHEGGGRLIDARRDRSAARQGTLTVRAGWVDVHFTPCDLALDLSGTLTSRGWQGVPTGCGPTCLVGRMLRAPA